MHAAVASRFIRSDLHLYVCGMTEESRMDCFEFLEFLKASTITLIACIFFFKNWTLYLNNEVLPAKFLKVAL
jgi:hypothetical protein